VLADGNASGELATEDMPFVAVVGGNDERGDMAFVRAFAINEDIHAEIDGGLVDADTEEEPIDLGGVLVADDSKVFRLEVEGGFGDGGADGGFESGIGDERIGNLSGGHDFDGAVEMLREVGMGTGVGIGEGDIVIAGIREGIFAEGEIAGEPLAVSADRTSWADRGQGLEDGGGTDGQCGIGTYDGPSQDEKGTAVADGKRGVDGAGDDVAVLVELGFDIDHVFVGILIEALDLGGGEAGGTPAFEEDAFVEGVPGVGGVGLDGEGAVDQGGKAWAGEIAGHNAVDDFITGRLVGEGSVDLPFQIPQRGVAIGILMADGGVGDESEWEG